MCTDDKFSLGKRIKKSGSSKISVTIGELKGDAETARLHLNNGDLNENLDIGRDIDLNVEIKKAEGTVTTGDIIMKKIPSQFNHPQGQNKLVKKILILSANPEDTSRLRLGEEVREIEEGLNHAPNRGQFQIQSKWAVRFKDLRRALLKYKPQIVHFSGHGEEDGLMVEGELGIAEPISLKALSGLFEQCSHHVECVILNACYSALQADSISKHINYVIGMPGKINDQAAIEFAVGFYDALGAGNTVEKAFKFGCNAIEQIFPDLPEHIIPVLKIRGTQ